MEKKMEAITKQRHFLLLPATMAPEVLDAENSP